VVQDVPRRQRIGIGLYDLDGDGQLHRRSLMHAELDAERTVVAGLASADAVVLNDQDLSYTRTGFDAQSRRVLTAAACQVGDPLSEAVRWNEFWLLVTSGEVPAGSVSRRRQMSAVQPTSIQVSAPAARRSWPRW
jgi:aminopeptidase N